MSNLYKKLLIDMREFIYEHGRCDKESCPLYKICDRAEDKNLSCCLCGEEDEKYISIIEELGGDDK